MVGTLEWARRTHGRLSARDRAELLVQGARRFLPRGSRLGAALDIEAYRPPDTPAAREAEEVCREASTPVLEAHCYRTHLWGVVIAGEEGVDYDAEAFYVAALTHDLGLTDRFRGHDPEAACFSLDSAAASVALLERHGWGGGRTDRVAEAITRHLNAAVPRSAEPVSYLLQLGAAIDVTGYRLGDIERDTRAAVLERHQRQAMKEEFKRMMDREVAEHPASRPAFFTKWGGFKRMVDRAPFES
jgi:HD superfamily phosphodiesterase